MKPGFAGSATLRRSFAYWMQNLDTPAVFNTIDADAPASGLDPLAAGVVVTPGLLNQQHINNPLKIN